MSEESQVFRGDRQPEISKVDTSATAARTAAPAAKVASSASFNDDVVPDASAAHAPASAAQDPAPASAAPPAIEPATPAPELKFEVDASQLWHAPETLAQRIANLQSTSAATAHLLDEQEAETRRIEQQLKSL